MWSNHLMVGYMVLAPSKLLQTRASFVHNVPQTLFSMLSMHRLAIVFLPATMEAAELVRVQVPRGHL
jgi:hypothetical protein